MGVFKGGALRLLQSFLYLLAFCCSAVILGLFSYFLAVLTDRGLYINNDWRAVEGLSGAAVVYTIFAMVLTCCLGGISFFAFLGIVLDICFIGVMIAIAILTRGGAYSCSADYLVTPIGSGAPDARPQASGPNNEVITYGATLATACRMEKACFAVSIIGIFVFLLTAIMQVVLVRHHKKEKRFGPSPSNNYTSGYGKTKKRGLFARKNKHATRDAELGTAGGLAVAQHDVRPSHDTAYTGTTVGGTGLAHDKVEPVNGTNGTHNTYYTQPVTTSTTNPYGYNTTTTTHTTTGTHTNY